jgi:hypothetical protein
MMVGTCRANQGRVQEGHFSFAVGFRPLLSRVFFKDAGVSARNREQLIDRNKNGLTLW